MFTRIRGWLGRPGMLLIWPMLIGFFGSLLTIYLAPTAAAPIFGLFALLFEPFPTIFCYSAVALFAYVVLRGALWRLPLSRSIVQWVAAASAAGMVLTIGYLLPSSWNAAGGLVPPSQQSRPVAVVLPQNGVIAFVSRGYPQGGRCGPICLSLLLQNKASTVIVASVDHEPAPLESLHATKYMLNAQTKSCLTGKPDYSGYGDTESRHRDFMESDSVLLEYDDCIDSQEVTVTPANQITVVDWVDADYHGDGTTIGYSGSVSVVRTVVPQRGGQPVIHEVRCRAGNHYVTPLFIATYAGDAGSGSYLAPSVAISYFQEPGCSERPYVTFWKRVAGSEDIGQKTASWLDGVVKHGPPALP